MSFNIENIRLFTPFENSDLCLWFYLLSVVHFVFFITIILLIIIMAFTKKKNSAFYMAMIFGALTYLFIYFQNRLLYSMCVKTYGK